MTLSTRTKDAIKTGLAMDSAYGIALQMGWDRPYWAAFAVAFISLPTAGQSLHKGALRMFGTLVAGVAALTLIALFPQQRWWFLIFLSVYIGFCTYLMTGKKNPYFYQVMAFARFPQLPVTKTLLPAILSCGFAGVIYIFVMPYLSGYLQLGLMIFSVTFGIAYQFHTPQQGLSRAFGLAFFAVLTSIANQQTYSFASFASSTVMIVLGLSLLLATSYIPFRPQPEKAFLRLLRRFFRHAEFLMSRMAMDRESRKGLAGRWKMMLYQNDLMELPQKLAAWGGQIDQWLFPANTPEQVQTLVNGLQAISLRIKDLLNARENPQSTMLVRELIDDVRAWRMALEALFQRWSDNPANESDVNLQERLAVEMNTTEVRIDQTLTVAEQGELGPQDYENFYRLMGSYRGLSESVVAHAQLAKRFDWTQWKEERF